MTNPSTDRYAAQHQAAIRAAAAVFAEKGYYGSSTRDIAERMGIKQGSLYYYFKSKEAALSEVCLFGMQDYAVSDGALFIRTAEEGELYVAVG